MDLKPGLRIAALSAALWEACSAPGSAADSFALGRFSMSAASLPATGRFGLALPNG